MLFGSPLNNEPFNHEQRKQLIHCKTWYEIINGEKKLYLIGKKKKVGVKKSRQKIWSVKKLVTCPKFSHFLPPNFLF